MATTEKGIYYPNDYSNVADVPEDMKKLAESVDTVVSNLDTNKVDKVDGKGLSTNDYTNEDKAKLDSLENYDDTEITQEIEDIQEEQAKQNEDIEDLKQINAKQDDLIQKLKDNSINITTEEATQLHVEDASTLPARLEVRGNHTQKTVKGIQILENTNQGTTGWAMSTSPSGLGVMEEVSYLGTRACKFKTTAEETSWMYISRNVNLSKLKNNTTYTLQMDVKTNYNEGTINIYIQDGSATNILVDFGYVNNVNGERRIKLVATTNDTEIANQILYIGLYALDNNSSNELIITNLILVEGDYSDTELEWEEYTGLQGSPSPDYPSEVEAVGDNVNMFNVWESGTISNSGNIESSDIAIRTADFISVKSNTSYTYKIYDETISNIALFEYDENSNFIKVMYNLNTEQTIVTSETTRKVKMRIVSTDLSTKMKFEEGEEATSYSPYGQGSVEVKKINKNWAKIDTPHTVERSGLNIEVDNEGVFTLNGTTTANMYINLINIEEYQNTTLTNYKLPLKKYKAYFDLIQKNNSAVSESNGDTSFNIRNFAASSTGEQVISYCVFGGLIKGNTGVQIKDCNITDNRIVTYLYVANGVKLDNFKFRFALYNEDETDTTYEKYKESSYVLPIQKPMLQGDYFVKEADGWKEVHGWNKYEFTGEENITYYNAPNIDKANTALTAYFTIDLPKLGENDATKKGNVFCNCFSNLFDATDLWANSDNEALSKEAVSLQGTLRIRINKTRLTNYSNDMTSTEKVNLMKQYLTEIYNTGNPIYVYYKLATPTKLPCTEAQSNVLDQLNELELFKGTNNIITAESLALMQMQYIADTETYIDNRIDEKLANINQQLLEIVGGN